MIITVADSISAAGARNMHWLTKPDLALVLLLVGIFLLYFEFNRPGTVMFAVLGMLSGMFGLYGLSRHTVSHASLVLALFGLALILLELRAPSRNFFAVLGTLILAYGLATLMPPPVRIDFVTALATSIVFSSVTLSLGRIALRARRNKRLSTPQVQPRKPTLASAAPARRVD